MTPMQIVCAVLAPLIWGYQYVVFKMGVAEFPPLFFLALRFIAIALLLIPFVPRPTRHEIGPIIAISVFLSGLNFGLFYTGLALGTGTMTAVAYQLASPFIILLAWPMLGDRPSLPTTVGVLLALGGVVVAAAGTHGSTNLTAALLVACAALAFAVGNVLTKRYGPFAPPDVDGMDVSLHRAPGHARFIHLRARAVGVAGDGGCTWLGNIGLYRCARRHWRVWPMVLAHCTLLNRPGGAVRPAAAGVCGGFERVFLGERLTAPLVVGGLISLVGVAATQLKPKARPCASRMQADAAADHLANSARPPAQVDLPMRRYDSARSARPIRREDSARTSV
jgi:O-acetylserine/cysteine efflux transporter